MVFLLYLKGRENPIPVEANFIREAGEGENEDDELVRLVLADGAKAKGYIVPEEVQAILPKNLVTSLTQGDP